MEGGGKLLPAMSVKFDKGDAGLGADESQKAQNRANSISGMKTSLLRRANTFGALRSIKLKSAGSHDALAIQEQLIDDALAIQEQLNESLQDRLAGVMDMMDSQSECIRQLEATVTQANARIQELESQVKEANGKIRERTRTGGLNKIREGADGSRYDSGDEGALGEAGGNGVSPNSVRRRRRSSGTRRRVGSSASSSVSLAETV